MSIEENAAIEKAIEESVSKYLAALANLDTLEMRQFYFDGDEFLMSMDGTIIKGKKGATNVLYNITKNFSKMSDIKTKNINISILSRESAAFTMEFKWTGITFENDTLKRKGTATYALKKVADRWKAVHLIGLHIPDESKNENAFTGLPLISN